jgi:hypothetical protein
LKSLQFSGFFGLAYGPSYGRAVDAIGLEGFCHLQEPYYYRSVVGKACLLFQLLLAHAKFWQS